MQRGGLKHKRSKPSLKPGSFKKKSGFQTALKAEQPTDRPMLGVNYRAPALKHIRIMLCIAFYVPQSTVYTLSVPRKAKHVD